MHRTRNAAYVQAYRGFESPPLRQTWLNLKGFSPSDGLDPRVRPRGTARFGWTFYQTWSGNDPQSVLNVRQYFASSVIYFGSPISADDVIAKDLKFASRWP